MAEKLASRCMGEITVKTIECNNMSSSYSGGQYHWTFID